MLTLDLEAGTFPFVLGGAGLFEFVSTTPSATNTASAGSSFTLGLSFSLFFANWDFLTILKLPFSFGLTPGVSFLTSVDLVFALVVWLVVLGLVEEGEEEEGEGEGRKGRMLGSLRRR